MGHPATDASPSTLSLKAAGVSSWLRSVLFCFRSEDGDPVGPAARRCAPPASTAHLLQRADSTAPTTRRRAADSKSHRSAASLHLCHAFRTDRMHRNAPRRGLAPHHYGLRRSGRDTARPPRKIQSPAGTTVASFGRGGAAPLHHGTKPPSRILRSALPGTRRTASLPANRAWCVPCADGGFHRDRRARPASHS